ncbi:hypothetical protein JCM8097_004493 [Rhodosporidiobolus ruineniae]
MESTKHTTIVCTLVARGAPDAAGQGSELLLFAPPQKRGRGARFDVKSDRLLFALQAAVGSKEKQVEAEKEKDLRAAAEKSVKETLLLDAAKDLRFVRRSELLPWTADTSLVAFLYRTTALYERGLDLEYLAASGRAPPEEEKTPEERERERLERATYWVVEKRLGRGEHSWVGFEEVERDLGQMKHEHLSTAFSLVVFPPLLDESLHFASSLPNLTLLDASDLALNTLLQLVRLRPPAGESAFKHCWPPHVPPPSLKTLDLPPRVVKYRLMMYWRDVVAYHFRQAVKPPFEPVTGAVFLHVLVPLLPLLLDTTTSVDGLVKAVTDAIAEEGARSRFAAAHVEKTGVAKILERASREKRKILHVVVGAGGDHPVLFGVLRELVHYVSTISAHPYASTNPHIHALTTALELSWASQPNLLHLTLAESRPLCTGAVLAARLFDVQRAAKKRAEELRGLASSYGNAYKHHPLEPIPGGGAPRTAQSGLKRRLLAGLGGGEGAVVEPHVEETLRTYSALDRLLERSEMGVHALPPPAGLGGTQVRIEVAPDAALASAMKATEGGAGAVVVLIGAEAVLPGGEVVAAVGSWMLAEMAKKLGAKVYVLALSDQILPSSFPLLTPLSPSATALLSHTHDPAELPSGWSNTLAAELQDLAPLAQAMVDPKENSVTGWTKASETVPAGLIDGYITEKGCLSAKGCAVLAKERAEAEKLLYGG